MNTDKTIPIEASESGSRNAYHHRCLVVGHCRPYAVCLHLCDQHRAGRLNPLYAECGNVIGKEECPALMMRKREVEAGYAIYFEERMIVVSSEIIEKAKQFVANLVKPVMPAKPTRVTSKKSGGIIDKIDDTGYAEVIKTTAVADVLKVEVKSGESLLDMARRMMGK